MRLADWIVLGVIAGAFYFFFFSGESPQEEIRIEEVAEIEEESMQEVLEPELNPQEPKPKPRKQPPLTLKKPPKAQPTAKYPNLDESFAPFDEQGNRYIEQVIKVGRHLVYHGDVLLGDEKDLPKLMKNRSIRVAKSRKWPDGKIPYVIDSSVAQVDKVNEAIEYLNIFTNIKIVPRTDEKDYVLITRGEANCYAYAGRVGGEQQIYLVPQCGVREIIHEWMHTLGFFHEQNREDRDQYLEIFWDNIAEQDRVQFKKLPNDFINVEGRPFDFDSIMLYSSNMFSQTPGEPSMLTSNGDEIPPSAKLLSDEDIERVNLAYPKTEED
jgi:hypothetical protein